jgi:MATE family multidrug resistance protein
MRDENLTTFSPGSLKELGAIVWPLICSFLSMSLMHFCNRCFLGRSAVGTLEACTVAMNLALLFQIPFLRITTIAQVFVARFKGAQQLSKMGEVVWQMIWLSLFSLLVTYPISQMIKPWFFQGASFEEIGSSYFTLLMTGNFLFPLGGALSAYFLGQGRTKVLIFALAITHVVQIGLDWFLIFGIPGWISPMGGVGAAVSTIAAQALYCFILLRLFLKPQEKKIYGTDRFSFQYPLFKECLLLGTPRAVGKMVILAAWSASVAILTRKGADFLLVFTLGTSLYAFFSCLNEGLAQGLITIISFYLGRKEPRMLAPIARTSLIALSMIMGMLLFPLVFFSPALFSILFHRSLASSEIHLLTHACYGLWFFFLCDGLQCIGFGFINALKEMKFYFVYTFCTILFFNFLPTYFAYQIGSWGAETVWWVMSLPCLASAVAYYFWIKVKYPLGKEVYENRS